MLLQTKRVHVALSTVQEVTRSVIVQFYVAETTVK